MKHPPQHLPMPPREGFAKRLFASSAALILCAMTIPSQAQTTGTTNVPKKKIIYELQPIIAAPADGSKLPISLSTSIVKKEEIEGQPTRSPRDKEISWTADRGGPVFLSQSKPSSQSNASTQNDTPPNRGSAVALDFLQPFVKQSKPEDRKVKVTATYTPSQEEETSEDSTEGTDTDANSLPPTVYENPREEEVSLTYLDFWIAGSEESDDDVLIVRPTTAQPSINDDVLLASPTTNQPSDQGKKVIHWAKVVVKHSVPGELPLLLQSAGSQPVYFYGEQSDPNQLSEEPELKEVLEQPYANNQYFWVGTDAKGEGTATIQAQGNLGTGYKNAPEQKTLKLVPVDLDFIKPGTENDTPKIEIDEEKEDSEGEVVNINWDDDDESEDDIGHGKLVFKNDFDDTAPNEKEDDMIQLKLHAINAAGAKAKLKYDANFVKIWRNRNRTGEIVSESTEIAVTETQIVYLEGRKLTAAEVPTIVEMLIKTDGNENYKSGDKVSVHVATPIITFYGKHGQTGGMASWNLGQQMHSKAYLGKSRRDDRENTVILKGKSQEGKLLWYSVDMVDVAQSNADPIGSLKNRPRIRVRTPHEDKEMKMALSLEGAHVFYNGHSNFGLGPNFIQGSTSTVEDYMNISGRGMASISVKTDDPKMVAGYNGNPMKASDHGGALFVMRAEDVRGDVMNYPVPIIALPRFKGNYVDPITKKTHTDGTLYHYTQNYTPEVTEWVTIVNSSNDIPILRYDSLFLASCNSGKHFSESFPHGTLLYSMDETVGIIGKEGKIGNDLHTISEISRLVNGKQEFVQARISWGITHYVRLLTDGKSWQQICNYFNENQFWENGKPPAFNQNYRHR